MLSNLILYAMIDQINKISEPSGVNIIYLFILLERRRNPIFLMLSKKQLAQSLGKPVEIAYRSQHRKWLY
jgi:hypothetical protein